MKTLISILAAVWFFGWGYWFLNERGHFNDDFKSIKSKKKAEIPVPEDTLALEEEPVPDPPFFSVHPPSDSINTIIDHLMQNRNGSEIVQVITYYTDDEPNDSREESPGILRTKNLMAAASKKYPIRILQPMSLYVDSNQDTTGIHQYYKVEKIQRDQPVRKMDDGRVLVFFPYASNIGLANDQISRVLDSLSTVWKEDGVSLTLSGNTDNDATEITNNRLGMDRARSVQKILIASGFPETRTTILSNGSKSPISSNRTAEGRYLNRRVEILPDK